MRLRNATRSTRDSDSGGRLMIFKFPSFHRKQLLWVFVLCLSQVILQLTNVTLDMDSLQHTLILDSFHAPPLDDDQGQQLRRPPPQERNAANQSQFYGWQPDDIPSTMECSWRKCFEVNHNCNSCRDGLNVMKSPPQPPDSWIPDVTMLYRMLLDGKDAKGRTWPPPLDPELCEDIDEKGGSVDKNKELFYKIPMKVQPLDPNEKFPTILCVLYTMETKHATTIRAIRETWAPHCDGFLAFSTINDPRIPAISIPHEGDEDYNNMWQKVRSMLKFVGTHYLEDFDFFYQGGDDMFIMPQNLKRYLQKVLDDTKGTPDDDFFLGRRFHQGGDDDVFNTGGPGYALSRGTLRKYVNQGWVHPQCHSTARTSAEDVTISYCLRDAFGILPMDTRDNELRERFHHFSPQKVYEYHPNGPDGWWFVGFNRKWPPLLNEMCCSPESVAFHYIRQPAMMRHLHALVTPSMCNNTWQSK